MRKGKEALARPQARPPNITNTGAACIPLRAFITVGAFLGYLVSEAFNDASHANALA